MFRVHLRQNVRYSCDRCQTSFDSREELRAHMRLDEPCPLRPHADDSLSSEVRVLDQAQYDSLPYRQRSIGDAEKWIRSYRILFRPTNDSQIPSPCRFKLATIRTFWILTSLESLVILLTFRTSGMFHRVHN